MRPHKLKMTAFGPFLKETIVDFDEMGDNVYLISGETGSGKTTIFDAIVLALYGKASGEGRSLLGVESFHSDLAKIDGSKFPMKVELEFSNSGREYRVSRTVSWGVKGRNDKSKHESVLEEIGAETRAIITNKSMGGNNDEVSSRIMEILGLDADQFRRIIMLAQGEFIKFLKAGSKERGEILGKLYDNRKHHDIEYRIAAAVRTLAAREARLSSDAQYDVNNLAVPEDLDPELQAAITDELRGKLNAEHMELIDAISSINKLIELQTETIDAQVEELRTARDKAFTYREKIRQNNETLLGVETEKRKLSKLEADAAYYSELEIRIGKGKSAEKVAPVEATLIRVQGELNKLRTRSEILSEQQASLKTQEEQLQTSLQTVRKENEKKQEAAGREAAQLVQMLEKYNKLELCSKAAAEFKNEKLAITSNYETINTSMTRLNEQLAAENHKLHELKDCSQATVELVQNKLEREQKLHLSLTRTDERLAELHKLYLELHKLEEATSITDAACKQAENNYHAIHQRFINGQAAVIAEEIKANITADGTAKCPVCGTVHNSASTSGFATCDYEVPTREAHDAAYNELQLRQSEAHIMSQRLVTRRSEYNSLNESLIAEVSELIGPVNADEDIADVINRAMAGNKAGINELENQLAYETSRLADRAVAEQRVVKLTDELDKAGLEKSSVEADMNEAVSKLTVAEAELALIRKELEGYPENKAAAEQRINMLEQLVSELAAEIQSSENEWNKCREQFIEVTTQLNEVKNSAETLQTDCEAARRDYEAAVSENGFGSEEEYHEASTILGRRLNQAELAAWLEQESENVAEYKKNVQSVSVSIKTLEDKLGAREFVDIAEIDDRISNIKLQEGALSSRREDLAAKLKTNSDVAERIGILKKDQAKLRRAIGVLKPLDLLNNKLNFSRYVLYNYFEKIVDRANLHLEAMSDGELSLVAQIEGSDGRKNTGLGLVIFDNLTGQERETATLSGGQSFQASLALALGLSEIVQLQNTSSIQIDSMFIDEGFGSLDDLRLDKAIRVLESLSSGSKQIGIISHIAKLDECLTKKIRVEKHGRESIVYTESDIRR